MFLNGVVGEGLETTAFLILGAVPGGSAGARPMKVTSFAAVLEVPNNNLLKDTPPSTFQRTRCFYH